MPAVETTPARPPSTIWEVSDDLWEEVVPIIDRFYPSARTGRPRADLRLVVERTIAWLQHCRALLIRYDKNPTNYLGLIQLASALLWYRRRHQLHP